MMIGSWKTGFISLIAILNIVALIDWIYLSNDIVSYSGKLRAVETGNKHFTLMMNQHRYQTRDYVCSIDQEKLFNFDGSSVVFW